MTAKPATGNRQLLPLLTEGAQKELVSSLSARVIQCCWVNFWQGEQSFCV